MNHSTTISSTRVEKAVVGGATTRYILAGPEVVEEFDGSNVWQARYVYEDGIDQPRSMDRADIADVNGNLNTTEVLRFHYHQQALGSVTEMTQPSGAVVEWVVYDVYGQPTVRNQTGGVVGQSALGNPFLFTGREFDAESGLFFYRARSYDPATGRFLQRDPLGFVDGLGLHEYARSNAITRRDSLGLESSDEREAQPLWGEGEVPWRGMDPEGWRAPPSPQSSDDEGRRWLEEWEKRERDRHARETPARSAALQSAYRWLKLYGPLVMRRWLRTSGAGKCLRLQTEEDGFEDDWGGGYDPVTGDVIIRRYLTDFAAKEGAEGHKPSRKAFKRLLVTMLHEMLHKWLPLHFFHVAVPRIGLGFGTKTWDLWVERRIEEMLFIIELRHRGELPWDPGK